MIEQFYLGLRGSFLSQKFLYIGDDIIGSKVRSVSLVRHSVSVAQELGKVPLDSIGNRTRQLYFEPLIERDSTVTVNVDLMEHVECNVVFLDKFYNVLICAGLLISELIAWES